jgi:endonuclease-3
VTGGGDSTISASAARKKCRRVAALLRQEYGRTSRRPARDAVDSLIATILSQNTSSANSSAAFANLKRRFRDWGAVADARVGDVERCIRVSGLSRIKAPRIRRILRRIRDERGTIDLEFLRSLTSREAREYLLRFEGVGPKTALCVLLFGLGRDVFPVDTHVYRLTRRLGLLPDGVAPATAHEALAPLVAPRDRYALHVLLIAHGRRVCRARGPRCAACVLLRLCPFGRRQRSGPPAGGVNPPGAMKAPRRGRGST